MSVIELVNEIKSGLKQVGASQKDEQRVMREMLNDREFQVGIYDKSGQVGSFCPAETAREMVANIVSGTTKVSPAEATQLAGEYEFGNKDASAMVDISKAYVNTYLDTGRKLPLGGTPTSMTTLEKTHIEAGTSSYPCQNPDGSWGTKTVPVPAYDKVKAVSPCPAYLK